MHRHERCPLELSWHPLQAPRISPICRVQPALWGSAHLLDELDRSPPRRGVRLERLARDERLSARHQLWAALPNGDHPTRVPVDQATHPATQPQDCVPPVGTERMDATATDAHGEHTARRPHLRRGRRRSYFFGSQCSSTDHSCSLNESSHLSRHASSARRRGTVRKSVRADYVEWLPSVVWSGCQMLCTGARAKLAWCDRPYGRAGSTPVAPAPDLTIADVECADDPAFGGTRVPLG